MGKIYNLSDLYNHCPDCTSDKFWNSGKWSSEKYIDLYRVWVAGDEYYCFCLINDILKREVQITENRLLLERVKNETGMYRTISENYDKQKKENMSIKTSLHSLQR